MAIIRYVGHPLVDVGAATITAFSGKQKPEDVDEGDLRRIVDYIEGKYSIKPMRSFLTVLFPNSGYVQPAFDRLPDKRRAYTDNVLNGYHESHGKLKQQCIFCGRLASMLAFRQHIPLLGGESIFNFYPEGSLGLPICGACMLCIQAFPLGSLNCNGRALIVHSDWDTMTLAFAKRFLESNQRTLQLADLEKMPKLSFAKTTLVSTLREIEEERERSEEAMQLCSITAYHLTNYGTNADIDIYHLPLTVMAFLMQANLPTYQGAWQRIINAAWEQPKMKKGEENQEIQRRNYLYEDLFSLPDEARRFLRAYFLRRPLRLVGRRSYEGDPRQNYNLGRDTQLVSWPLTTLFLKEVLSMEAERIEAIRELADRLTDYNARDPRLLTKIHRAKKYPDLRLLLVTTDLEVARTSQPPLLTFDNFITVFEEGIDIPYKDWSLVRDLILIRMIEQLHQRHQLDEEQLKDMAYDSEAELEEAGIVSERRM